MNKYIFLLLLCLLPACTSRIQPLPVDDIGRFAVQSLAKLDNSGLMSVSVDGRLVAWSDNALILSDLETDQRKRLLEDPPAALCWSPDGSSLVAVIRKGQESQLYVFDRTGIQVYEQRLPGRIGRLQWPQSGSLTASILEFKTYSFGTHIAGHLLRWDSRWRSSKTLLYETTIKPVTAAQLAGRLHETLDFDISPFGDEILYARLYAPPAFAAERHLVLRNLQTADEKKIAYLPLLSGMGRLSHDGESALVANGLGAVTRQNLWSSEVLQTWPGLHIDYDATSGLLLLDHKLYQDNVPLLNLPPKSQTQISVGGKFLLINWKKQLYLLTGYPVSQNEALDALSTKKLIKLRRLRSRGLIDPDEYLQSRKRLLQ